MAYNLNMPFVDDMFVEAVYDISEENYEKFERIRKMKNSIYKFNVADIIDGELEFVIEAEIFVNKYY